MIDPYEFDYKTFSILEKKIPLKIEVTNNNNIVFYCTDCIVWCAHTQDCCESVWIDDICGDMTDLIGSPILVAEEVTNRDSSGYGDSITWTFYKLDGRKGGVTIRWCGESNGYYSESVDTNHFDILNSGYADTYYFCASKLFNSCFFKNIFTP